MKALVRLFHTQNILEEFLIKFILWKLSSNFYLYKFLFFIKEIYKLYAKTTSTCRNWMFLQIKGAKTLHRIFFMKLPQFFYIFHKFPINSMLCNLLYLFHIGFSAFLKYFGLYAFFYFFSNGKVFIFNSLEATSKVHNGNLSSLNCFCSFLVQT